MQNIDWNNIRPLNHSQKNSFEELVCQLARNDRFENAVSFVRKGSPDAGVECFWVLSNFKEIAYQAKFFTSPLSSTQWGELDKSIKTALDKHSNLCKYIVSIPQDRADARIEGKTSFLDKWNESVLKWKNWAQAQGLDVDFVYEGSSELLTKLSMPENIGKAYFWFSKNEFSKEWFNDNNKRKVKDLGARYSEELNILSDTAKIFELMIFPLKLKKILFSEYESLEIDFKSYLNISKQYPEIHEKLIKLLNNFLDKGKLLHSYNISDLKQPEILSHTILMQMDSLIRILYENYAADDIKINRINSKNTLALKAKYKVTSYSINKFLTILDSLDKKIAINPFLLIEGDAGIGKSHLFADFVTTFYKDLPSVLLLGQQFYSENLWLQISNQLQINCSKEEFLGILNSIGESLNCRVPILIDAINEGGKQIWKEQLSGFVNDIRSYPHIALIISIRSTYTNYVLSKSNLKDFERYTIEGFRNLPEVTKTFFKFYKINDLPVPILNPEFKNPLFLKLFCIGLKDNNLDTLPDDYDNITVIYNYYYHKINKILADRLAYDYRNFNLVLEAISLLADDMVRYKTSQLSREVANIILIEKYRYSLPNAGMILSELIKENVLNENIVGNKEIIYFSYEKLGDYIIAKSLLNLDSNKIKLLAETGTYSIDQSFNLFEVIKNDIAVKANLGIIEAISILLPEMYNLELFQLRKSTTVFLKPLLKSLLWRNSSTIKDITIDYINKNRKLDKAVASEFVNTLLQLSIKPNHRLNIYFVDALLSQKKLTEIDLMWTIHINNSEAGKILVNWALEISSFSNLHSKTKKIFAFSLSWLFCSTNREIRDKATRALAKLLQNDYSILINLINKFKVVEDIYILERLVGVLYGITLRLNDKENILEIVQFVNSMIKAKEFRRHLLIENYVQGIINYASTKGISDKNDYIQPDITSDKDLFKVKLDSKLFFKRHIAHICHDTLVSYISGEHSFIHKFLGKKANFRISNFYTSDFDSLDSIINNTGNVEIIGEIIKLIKLKSDSELTSMMNIGNIDDDIQNLYEQLINYETLKPQDVLNIRSFFNEVASITDSQFNIDTLQYYISNDVFNIIGWNGNDFKEHDYPILSSNFYKKNLFNLQESIGEKYIFISFYKWLSIVSSNYLIAEINPSKFKYNRYKDLRNLLQTDIDPTIFFSGIMQQKNSSNKASEIYQFNSEELLGEWICLGSSDPGVIKNSNFQFVRKCLIINASDAVDYLNYLRNDELILRDFLYLNTSQSNHYLGELHWREESKLIHKQSNRRGYLAAITYRWSKDNDFSLNDDLQFLVPSYQLSQILDIAALIDGRFYDKDENVVAVTTFFNKNNTSLFINKKYFINKMKSKGLNALILKDYAKSRSKAKIVKNISLILND
ncbi:hypothetical protein [Chryseobacterium sp. JAH]|uniref:hypothetical protein n=1 Tax=Chryseobacterium sp. JAH TaxID=1742858 RepID=UPI0007413140|nr:hypothetical protein [Chryseobacterium sp. JAH]KUJ49767.1 hypothetical protein AR685_17640 [Chryseobacterium sp. JAH]